MNKPSRHRYPIMIIGQAIWQYHRFNQSYRDVREQFLYWGIDVSHETIRNWCYKFGKDFKIGGRNGDLNFSTQNSFFVL